MESRETIYPLHSSVPIPVSHPAPLLHHLHRQIGPGRQGQGNLVSEETFEFRRAQIRPGGDLNHRIIGSRRDEAFRAEAMPFRLRFPIVWTNAAPLARASPRLFGQDSWMVAGSPSNKKICTMKVTEGCVPAARPSRKFADSSSIASPSPAPTARSERRSTSWKTSQEMARPPGTATSAPDSQTAKPVLLPMLRRVRRWPPRLPTNGPSSAGNPARSVPPFLPRIPRPRAR